MLDIELKLKDIICDAFKQEGIDVDKNLIVIERSKDKAHGDYASTIALQMARTLHQSPRDIANNLVKYLHSDFIENIEKYN